MVNTDNRADDPDFQLIDESGPDVRNLSALYRDTVEDLTDHIEQADQNHDTRHCIWPGQSEDQRKHAIAGSDNQPFPWDGASDLKVPVADEIVNHGVALDCVALQRANVRAVAVEGGDLGKAAVVSNFMRWLLMSQMTELPKQAEILSNYRRERGIGVLGIFWQQSVQKTQQPISLDEIGQSNPDVATAITEGLFTPELAQMLAVQFNVSTKKARRMLQELRDTGSTTVPYVVRQVNRPVVAAYAVGADIFFPPNTQDLQSARVIFRRQWMTPEQLREKTVSDGWDKEYVEYAITRCMGADGTPISNENLLDSRWAERIGVTALDEFKGLVEVVFAYERLSDEDGVPGIYCTVFCPSAHTDENDGPGYAKYELLGYRHGLYPFVEFNREYLSRLLLDTRGVPEVARGFQDAIKTEIDARRDNASLATVPPVRHPVGRAPGRLGPGTMIAERRPQEYGFMETPPPPQASVEIQGNLDNMARKYFGRPVPDDATGEWQIKQQKEVQAWLKSWERALDQTWQLWMQYGPEEEWFRVIGSGSENPEKFVKSEFQGRWDFYLAFDTANNSPDVWKDKIKAVSEAMAAFDRNGQGNYDRALYRVIEMIDPIWAEEFVIPKGVAAQKEVSETEADLSRMWAGVDKDAPTVGVNPQLRLQTIQNWTQGVPDNPAVDVQARLAADPALQNRIKRYVDQLQFQVTQQTNAQIGRLGAAPAGSVTVGQ